MGSIHPTVSEICVPQSLDPICAKFDNFLTHGQALMGQMGKWPWQCTTTGLDNSTELRMEKIHQEVTEIWVPQVWQPPARPPARTVTTIPLQPGGLRGKKDPSMLHIQYPGCWWPGDAIIQGISSHGSDLVTLEYSGSITRWVNFQL